ncbi:MAG: SRPBCC family protein [Devosia sp.]|nr:SRPBCC family protein [Devosia sp.]
MMERSIVHGTFTVDRTYAHPIGKVFSAWSNPEFKRQWFGSPDPANPSGIFEFREGGREYNADKMGNDAFTFDVRYHDIVPDNRIIYTYEMTMNARRISVSVATISFTATPAGTRMVVREDGAYLDGLDNPRQREDGTNYLMDQLGAWLDRP